MPAGTQIWWELLQKVMKSKGVSRLERCTLVQLLAGTLATRSQLAVWGYDVDVVCDCGMGVDDPAHRLFSCGLSRHRCHSKA
eukprot:10639756-Prorocentrum_lima.AAC.1